MIFLLPLFLVLGACSESEPVSKRTASQSEAKATRTSDEEDSNDDQDIIDYSSDDDGNQYDYNQYGASRNSTPSTGSNELDGQEPTEPEEPMEPEEPTEPTEPETTLNDGNAAPKQTTTELPDLPEDPNSFKACKNGFTNPDDINHCSTLLNTEIFRFIIFN